MASQEWEGGQDHLRVLRTHVRFFPIPPPDSDVQVPHQCHLSAGDTGARDTPFKQMNDRRGNNAVRSRLYTETQKCRCSHDDPLPSPSRWESAARS